MKKSLTLAWSINFEYYKNFHMLAYVTRSVEVYSMVQLIDWKRIHDGQKQGSTRQVL